MNCSEAGIPTFTGGERCTSFAHCCGCWNTLQAPPDYRTKGSQTDSLKSQDKDNRVQGRPDQQVRTVNTDEDNMYKEMQGATRGPEKGTVTEKTQEQHQESHTRRILKGQ